MGCPACQRLEEVVAEKSRDWAFAEQLTEVSGRAPELAEPARRKADSARKEYGRAAGAQAEHQQQRIAFQSRGSNDAAGVS